MGIVEDKNPNAVYLHKCKKCGCDRAELMVIEPGYSDADHVIRFKCGKCNHTEQEKGHFT